MRRTKKKKKYSTEYYIGRHKFSQHIWAYSWKEAERIAKERNIGEKVYAVNAFWTDGYGRKVPEEINNPDFRKLNDYEFLLELSNIIHAACFMGYIAIRSGRETVENIIGDMGIVHELIHLQKEPVNTREIRRIRGRFAKLQDQTPGMFPRNK